MVLSARNGSCGIKWNIAGTVISSEMAVFFCAPGGAPVEIVSDFGRNFDWKEGYPVAPEEN